MRKRINRNIKRVLSTVLMTSIAMTYLSFHAVADEDVVYWGEERVVTKENIKAGVKTTTTTSVRSGSNADDTRFEKEISKEIEKEDLVGNWISSSEWYEKSVTGTDSNAAYNWTKGNSLITGEDESYAPLSLTLKPGEKISVNNTIGDPVETGKLPNDENENYDWALITELRPRTVVASMSNAAISVGETTTPNALYPLEVIEPDPSVVKNNLYGGKLSASGLPAESAPEGYDFFCTGCGNFSDIQPYLILRGNETFHWATPIKIVDHTTKQLIDGTTDTYTYTNVHTTYCVDLDTDANVYAWYRIDNLEAGNSYYETKEAQDKIRAIIKNGYWSTESGLGSLESIRKKLQEAVNEDGTVCGIKIAESKEGAMQILAGISVGEALTATQCAIWSYSNGNEEKNVIIDVASRFARSEEEITEDSDIWKRTQALYCYLRSLTEQEEETKATETKLINEKNFIDSLDFTVKDKIRDNGENDTYKVDLAIKMSVEPQKDDNLVLKLLVNDQDGNKNILKQVRISGVSTEEEIASGIVKINPVDGKYILSNLKLEENTTFDFQIELEGEQNLKTGVYMYYPYGGRDASQSLVGLASGPSKVDVEMQTEIVFDVEERILKTEHEWSSYGTTPIKPTEPENPTVIETTAPTTESETSSIVETTTASETTTSWVEDDDDDNEPETTPTTAAPATTAPETTVPETSAQEPTTSAPTVIYRGVEIPQSILDAYPDKTLDELYDMGVLGAYFENVPTGLLPATNDMSVIWTAMSVLSAIGLAGVSVIGKKREDDEE